MPKGETSRGKGEKTKKRITVIDGVLLGEAPIFVIQSGNDFESIRGDKHITRIKDRRLIGAAQPFSPLPSKEQYMLHQHWAWNTII